MAVSLSSSILSVKTVLISVGFLSAAFILNLSLPLVLEFIVNQLPQLWNSMKSWLAPPYLYILINGIILTIAASSRFHHQHGDKISDDQDMEILTTTAPLSKIQANQSLPDFPISSVDDDKEIFVISRNYPVITEPEVLDEFVTEEKNNPVVSKLETEPVKMYGQLKKSNLAEMKSIIDSTFTDGAVNSTSTWTLNRGDSIEIPSEYSDKPPMSSRFGHRKSTKSNNECGKGLRSVANRKRNDTLESTWKTITELARHLKKSDTWETHNTTSSHVSSASLSSSSAAPLSSDHQFNQLNKMKKSETFIKDGVGGANTTTTTLRRGNSGKLRKEPSLSQDDLNRRVEAFINKFNEEMRLQRQESLIQYNEMVKQGLVTKKGE
ncbi:hypothetical protein C5167_043077 [Papaver somniferum]|uniref:DUF4408 domain-containing protein n=1 Tax=Papaver somniferum TaxID=3469 RepID=A0A4Y7L7T6_PAPSO|nr:uncharacterized protein LOC113317091 [Papaver somniferum]RZC80508.1 hypothetical protein C5167_043077 [Papaver somniferum]